MSASFLLTALLMVLAASLFVVVLPCFWRRSARGESTLDWLRLRRRELAEEAPELLAEAEVRVVDELPDGEPEVSTVRRLPLWVLPIVLLSLTLFLYTRLGALEDVQIAADLGSLEAASPAEIDDLVARIEARLERQPGNIDYLFLLAEYYAGSAKYDRALVVYDRLLEHMPENPDVLARAAQAEFMRDDRTLSSRARGRAQAALAVNPNSRAALGTLGMAAFESGDYPAAIGHWERLLAMETPGTPGHDMMAGVLEQARSRAAEAGGLPPEPASQQPEASAGITVVVRAPEGVNLAPDTTVFVLARAAGSAQRMPLAVIRERAGNLPLTVRLDDSNSMAGQTLSSVAAVDVEVQVSPSGQPGRAAATWLATASGVLTSRPEPLTLVLTAPGA